MPELCEIEVIKNDLLDHLKNEKILSFQILYDKIFSSSISLDILKNQEIKNFSRKGKYLIFEVASYYLIFHLRMTGHIFLKDKSYKISKHDHFVINLSNEKKIIYYDPRKFGKIYLTKDKDLFFQKLAKDPFEINFLEFLEKLKTLKKPIKQVLLDQSIISGIGNIYANEALYLSKIHPSKITKNLTKKNLEDLLFNTKKILSEGIKNKGCSLGNNRSNFSSIFETMGNHQNYLFAHKKENENCIFCKNKIIKLKLYQRSSYICSNCQKN
jgi:formamidopyrimidine-DNA glycosylase